VTGFPHPQSRYSEFSFAEISENDFVTFRESKFGLLGLLSRRGSFLILFAQLAIFFTVFFHSLRTPGEQS
jgi:hypothetical protein